MFFTHSHVDGHLHYPSFVNSAAMNIGVHVNFSIIVFSGYMPSHGIADHMVVLGFPGGSDGKESTCNLYETWV